MKKVFLLLLLCLTLTSCHSKIRQNSFNMPENFDETQNISITFWAKNDTNKTQIEIYENAIKNFEKLYPNIEVTLRAYNDYGKIYNDVITNIATNTTPNVCITYPDHIATYLTGENTVLPLTDLMKDKEYGLGGTKIKFDATTKEEIVPKFLNECSFDDEYYALPFMRSTEACYVNKTFVEKLGYTLPDQLTWDFMWEVAEAATQKDKNGNYLVNGQKTMLPIIYKSTDNMMIQMLKQKNADYSDSEGDIKIFNEVTKEILLTISKHAKTGAFSTFKISSYPANFLNAGQCIFAIDSTAGATWMGSNAPLIDISEEKMIDFETVVMTIPQFDLNAPRMISQGPSACIFNKENPQEVLASWLFLQFLLTNDVQISYSQTEGYIPVTYKAQNSNLYLDYLSREGENNELYYDIKLKATKLLIDNIDNTFVTPVFNGSASLRDAAGQLIESTTKSTQRKQIINDKYLDSLFNNVSSMYRLDQISNNDEQKIELGPMPTISIVLIISISIIWVCIIVSFICKRAYKNKNK